jgi:hypothetical protein
MERPDQDLETSKRANHAKARADAIYFDGHRYLGVSLRTHPPFDRVGSIPESHLQRIGTATRKPGHRTKHAVTGSASPPPVEVASIEGVSPEIAIAGVPRGNVYLREGATIPSALTSAPWVQWRMCS